MPRNSEDSSTKFAKSSSWQNSIGVANLCRSALSQVSGLFSFSSLSLSFLSPPLPLIPAFYSVKAGFLQLCMSRAELNFSPAQDASFSPAKSSVG